MNLSTLFEKQLDNTLNSFIEKRTVYELKQLVFQIEIDNKNYECITRNYDEFRMTRFAIPYLKRNNDMIKILKEEIDRREL